MNELQFHYSLYDKQPFLLPNPNHYLSRIPLLPEDARVDILESYDQYVTNKLESPGYRNFASYLIQALHYIGPRRVLHFIITDFNHWGFLHIKNISYKHMTVQIGGIWIQPVNILCDKQLIFHTRRFLENLMKDRNDTQTNGAQIFKHMKDCARAHNDCYFIRQSVQG